MKGFFFFGITNQKYIRKNFLPWRRW